jgi:dienelactone hydrolase
VISKYRVGLKRVVLTSTVTAACLLASDLVRAQTLEVVPARVLLDESAVIRANGLQPKETVVIQATLTDGAEQSWSSQAKFVADSQGSIDLSKQGPVDGSYKEVSAMGLIWSMRPAEKNVNIYRPPENPGRQIIQFQLLRGGAQVAAAQLEQQRIAEGVRRIRVTSPVHGILFVPNTGERRPGVLVVGGSEGGLPVLKAAWLASHGFAALAVAYFRYEDLPQNLEAIPLEYFGQALSWMMNRPEVLSDRIAVLGTSRGGELALQLGSMYPQIQSVVAYVPANVRYPACCGNTAVPYAWTWQGRPLSFVRPRLVRDAGVLRESAIKVEQTHGPILLISGQDDGVWQSSEMADSVIARLKQARFSYSFEHLKYAHAGHTAGRPEIIPEWHGPERNPVSGREVDPGGTVAGNAQSSLDAIPKVLEFLRQSLKP